MPAQVTIADARERAGISSLEWDGEGRGRTAPFQGSSFRSA